MFRERVSRFVPNDLDRQRERSGTHRVVCDSVAEGESSEEPSHSTNAPRHQNPIFWTALGASTRDFARARIRA